MEPLTVFVGWDDREERAWNACVASLLDKASIPLRVRALDARALRAAGLYWRPRRVEDGQRTDLIDGRPFSTDFAFTRFLVPELMRRSGWAVFCDADFLWRADIALLFRQRQPRFPVQVVQHAHRPAERIKMDGQEQAGYPRKNWSSLILWNCGHHAHDALTVEAVNTWSGRHLHAFAWLDGFAIGGLAEGWNWLEGYSPAAIEPQAVHFTRGTPDMPGYEHAAYADEWWEALGMANPARAFRIRDAG